MAANLLRRHPDYAGLLIMMFIVDGLDISFRLYYLQLRPANPSSPMPLLVDEEAKRMILEDVLKLAIGSVNAGIPFPPVEGSESGPEDMVLALPGRFVRRKNASWTWPALFSSWADHRKGAHRELDVIFDKIKLRNTPADTLIAFNWL